MAMFPIVFLNILLYLQWIKELDIRKQNVWLNNKKKLYSNTIFYM